MCTLTVIPLEPAGARLVCNRDESRLRPRALPPELRHLGDRQALMPIDPLGGGTWIGASDAPLAAVLMNVYLAQAEPLLDILPRTEPPVSRGTIIPQVLAGRDLADAVQRFETLNPRRFEPFRLLLIDRASFVEILWAAEQLAIDKPKPIEAPLFFTSSGLGDDVVATPRRKLFEEMFAPGADWSAAQDAFHRHVWPGREFASVWMTRPEARTQSITWVELGRASVTTRYGERTGEGNELELGPVQSLATAN